MEQSTARVFQVIRRIVTESSPQILKGDAVTTKDKVEFPASGATITALFNDYAGPAALKSNDGNALENIHGIPVAGSRQAA